VSGRADELALVSFNLYWLGARDEEIIARSPEDEALIAEVLSGIDADIWVLQEVQDLDALARIVADAGSRAGRSWVFRHVGAAVTSAEEEDDAFQVVVAWDPARVIVEGWTRLPGPVGLEPSARPRRPVAVTVRDLIGRRWTIVGCHLKSGLLDAPLTDRSAARRRAEAAGIAAWVEGRGGADEGLVVVGDLNERRGHASLAPLEGCAALRWLPHRWPEGVEPWTVWLGRATIDHALVGAGVTAEAADVLAWDTWPARGGAAWWHAVDEGAPILATPHAGLPRQPCANVYRVSDHRALRLVLRR
jgi:endonuclease/exonuclease/phosphatase family metal-dependent hydrolase